MSQRGSRPVGTYMHSAASWGQSYWRVIPFTLALFLCTAFTLIAQDTPTPQAKNVVVRVDGTERQVTTVKDTVQTLLHQEDIALGQHDRCEPPLAAPITEGMTVTVTRVTCERVKERVSIPAPVITRWHRRMTTNPVPLHEGRPGVAEVTRVVWKKDGVVSAQWIESKRTVVKPVSRIVIRGNLPSRAGVAGRRALTMVSTAYDPGPLSCGPHANGRTAIGMRATRGVVAVDPRVIPLGSRVYVDGYGMAIAADTGGAIKGNRIDVCFPSRSEALRWGRRTVTVVVLQ